MNMKGYTQGYRKSNAVWVYIGLHNFMQTIKNPAFAGLL
jgi:hypothetical protein